MSNLKVIRNGAELKFNSFNFPAGEVGLKLDLKTNWVAYTARTGIFTPSTHQTIIARIKNSNDVMELLMLTDALKKIDKTPIRLLMPYCPYSRQDRVCDKGEAFSLNVFSNLINLQKFEAVCVVDPHSDVLNEKMIDNLVVVSQFDIINDWPELIKRALKCTIVAPDAGALKKTFKLAQFFERNFIRSDKVRDVSTGEIKETIVYNDDFKGSDVIVFDDICDGGRTFIELAKVCKVKNCGKFVLYVTHGIFSKGIPALINNGIDEIWTTNSLTPGYLAEENNAHFNSDVLKILKLEEKIEL